MISPSRRPSAGSLRDALRATSDRSPGRSTSIGSTPRRRKRLEQLPVDELDAAAQRRRRRRRSAGGAASARSRSSTHRQQVADQIGRRRRRTARAARARCACGSCRTRRRCAAADRAARRARCRSAVGVVGRSRRIVVRTSLSDMVRLLPFEQPGHGLRHAVDDGDGALIAHPRRADHADRAGALAVAGTSRRPR